MYSTLILILQVWVGGGVLVALFLLLSEGGWAGVVEKMEEDNPAEGLLSNKQAAGLILLFAFFAWPYVVIQVVVEALTHKDDV